MLKTEHVRGPLSSENEHKDKFVTSNPTFRFLIAD
jgi:hypothetical protein